MIGDGDKTCYAAEHSQESLTDYTLTEPTRSEDGFLAYPINSKYEQEGADLRILLPEEYSKRGRFNRFLFVLPVSRKEDYHHGNGTQAIFYDSDAVLFISIHGDPNRTYPFFAGFEEERGEGRGRGMNRNFPLGEGVNGSDYLAVLGDALEMISQFDPAFLVVSLGVDIYQEDPLGDFDVSLEVFADIGREIRQMNRPTLFVQEGGYHLDSMGLCVVQMLTGFEARI